MSNYTKSTNFATKDNLTPGDPLKVVRGTEIDTEFNNISTAIATKTDNSAAAITGGTITGITDLAVADGGTGASTASAALNNLLPSQTSNANKYLQTDGTNASWDAVTLSTADITGTLAVANGGTGVTSSTGTGSVVLSNSPTLVTPALGTPASGTATNLTGLPISTGVSGLGTGVATFLGTPSSANLASAVSDETGSGALVFANTPTLVTPILGTPTSATLTNATGLPISTGVSGLGTGIATALAVNTGSAGAPVLFNGALGTPSSGTVTNLTGTASININGTVGATTATTGAFTTLSTSGRYTANNGVRIAGGATLGATEYGLFSYDSPSTRFFIGDGTGYSFIFSKRASSTTTDLATFTDTGNLGLGVTPSAWGSSYKALQIPAGSISAFSTTQLGINQNAYDTGVGTFVYVNTATASRYLQLNGQHQFYTAASGTAGNAISFTQAMTLNASGGLQTLNTIGVGNATPSTSGAGITFPATQSASSNANTLDDYEEGTWTPTLAWSTPGTSVITPTSSSGQYTKVGNMAYCAFNFDNATFTNGTASGYLILSGLPFTSSSSATAIWGGSITTNIGFPTNLQNTLVDTGATTATFKKSDGSASNVVVADVSGAGKYIRVAFMYRTA